MIFPSIRFNFLSSPWTITEEMKQEEAEEWVGPTKKVIF